MDRTELQNVLQKAAQERCCTIVSFTYDDDDNVIDVTIDRPGERVSLADCEYVHRAVLAAFDRNVEDYAMTVSSVGIAAAEADALLRDLDQENKEQ